VPPPLSKEFLEALRNDIPVSRVIRFHLELPAKERDGLLRFLCPLCGEFHTATNPTTNLARCFRCKVNFNPIDLVMAVERCTFLDAVKILTPWLEVYRASPNRHRQRHSPENPS
jgi:DNA primase